MRIGIYAMMAAILAAGIGWWSTYANDGSPEVEIWMGTERVNRPRLTKTAPPALNQLEAAPVEPAAPRLPVIAYGESRQAVADEPALTVSEAASEKAKLFAVLPSRPRMTVPNEAAAPAEPIAPPAPPPVLPGPTAAAESAALPQQRTVVPPPAAATESLSSAEATARNVAAPVVATSHAAATPESAKSQPAVWETRTIEPESASPEIATTGGRSYENPQEMATFSSAERDPANWVTRRPLAPQPFRQSEPLRQVEPAGRWQTRRPWSETPATPTVVNRPRAVLGGGIAGRSGVLNRSASQSFFPTQPIESSPTLANRNASSNQAQSASQNLTAGQHGEVQKAQKLLMESSDLLLQATNILGNLNGGSVAPRDDSADSPREVAIDERQFRTPGSAGSLPADESARSYSPASRVPASTPSVDPRILEGNSAGRDPWDAPRESAPMRSARAIPSRAATRSSQPAAELPLLPATNDPAELSEPDQSQPDLRDLQNAAPWLPETSGEPPAELDSANGPSLESGAANGSRRPAVATYRGDAGWHQRRPAAIARTSATLTPSADAVNQLAPGQPCVNADFQYLAAAGGPAEGVPSDSAVVSATQASGSPNMRTQFFIMAAIAVAVVVLLRHGQWLAVKLLAGLAFAAAALARRLGGANAPATAPAAHKPEPRDDSRREQEFLQRVIADNLRLQSHIAGSRKAAA